MAEFSPNEGTSPVLESTRLSSNHSLARDSIPREICGEAPKFAGSELDLRVVLDGQASITRAKWLELTQSEHGITRIINAAKPHLKELAHSLGRRSKAEGNDHAFLALQVALFNKLVEFDPARGNFQQFLWGVVYRGAIDELHNDARGKPSITRKDYDAIELTQKLKPTLSSDEIAERLITDLGIGHARAHKIALGKVTPVVSLQYEVEVKDTVQELAQERDQAQQLRDIVNKLPPLAHRLLVWKLDYDLSGIQIAHLLECSEPTVSRYLATAHNAVRTILDHDGAPELSIMPTVMTPDVLGLELLSREARLISDFKLTWPELVNYIDSIEGLHTLMSSRRPDAQEIRRVLTGSTDPISWSNLPVTGRGVCGRIIRTECPTIDDLKLSYTLLRVLDGAETEISTLGLARLSLARGIYTNRWIPGHDLLQRNARSCLLRDDIVGPEAGARNRLQAVRELYPHLDRVTSETLSGVVCELLGSEHTVLGLQRALVALNPWYRRLPGGISLHTDRIPPHFETAVVDRIALQNVRRFLRERFPTLDHLPDKLNVVASVLGCERTQRALVEACIVRGWYDLNLPPKHSLTWINGAQGDSVYASPEYIKDPAQRALNVRSFARRYWRNIDQIERTNPNTRAASRALEIDGGPADLARELVALEAISGQIPAGHPLMRPDGRELTWYLNSNVVGPEQLVLNLAQVVREHFNSMETWHVFLSSKKHQFAELRRLLTGSSEPCAPAKLPASMRALCYQAVRSAYPTIDDIKLSPPLLKLVGISREDISLPGMAKLCVDLGIYSCDWIPDHNISRGRQRSYLLRPDIVGPAKAQRNIKQALREVYPTLASLTKETRSVVACELLGCAQTVGGLREGLVALDSKYWHD